jgi:hypothetical protein
MLAVAVDGEKAKIQPAEPIPRAPHTATPQPIARNNKQNAFGAGIW